MLRAAAVGPERALTAMTGPVPLSADLLPALHDFVAQLWAQGGARSEMHLGDLYCTLFWDGAGELERCARLWFDGRSNIAAAAFFTGATFDMLVRPDVAASQLAADMLSWAVAEARRRDPHTRAVRVQRRPQLAARVALLERLGFRRMREGALALARTLDDLPPRRSPARGFACRELQPGDVPARLRAHADAFPGQAKALADYERLARCAGYRADLDLVVAGAAGDVAAFCTAWFDRLNSVGLFEPVGTCETYRRRGLASTGMTEALHRLKALGATSAVVRTRSRNAAAIACYERLGFTLACDVFGFEKSLDAARETE